MTAEILVFGLLNGQEIIGYVHDYGNESTVYHVEKPRAVIIRQNPDGGMGMAFAPYPILADQNEVQKEGVYVNKNVVAYSPIKPEANIVAGYRQHTSGLITPTPGMLLG